MDRNNNRVFMFLSQKITIFEQQNKLKRIYKTQKKEFVTYIYKIS